jgi:hypothetical protein
MTACLVLAKVIDPELFVECIKGHVPTLGKFGGRVVFRSIDNVTVHCADTWGAIALAVVARCRPLRMMLEFGGVSAVGRDS